MNYIQHRFRYNFLLLTSELHRRKSGHRDPRNTFQVSEDNTSWATRCQHWPSITPRIGCMLLKITIGDVNHIPCTGGCCLQ